MKNIKPHVMIMVPIVPNVIKPVIIVSISYPRKNSVRKMLKPPITAII